MARIRVIEDEPDLQQGLSYNLLLAGHVGISALQGNEGLNLAQTQHPGLILPDLSGFEICKTLKAVATTRSIPIVTFTAKKFLLNIYYNFLSIPHIGSWDFLTPSWNDSVSHRWYYHLIGIQQRSNKIPFCSLHPYSVLRSHVLWMVHKLLKIIKPAKYRDRK